MINKQDLLSLLQKEFTTTIKVMHAFPGEKLDFTPHERSSTAKLLMSTFIFEMYLLSSYVLGEQIDNSKFKTYDPQDLKTLISDFEKETTAVIKGIESLSDADLLKSIEFGGRTFVANQFVLMMLHDQIHHRGQLSVYVRMAGGKVPSIYGPSADDTSTNL